LFAALTSSIAGDATGTIGDDALAVRSPFHRRLLRQ
jgi:hypothetical protein